MSNDKQPQSKRTKEEINKGLRDILWRKIEPSIEAYGDIIDRLVKEVDNKTLAKIVKNL